MKTVFINYREGKFITSQLLPISQHIQLESAFVDLTNYFKKEELGVLIQFTHQQITTLLDLTRVAPYVLLYFDKDLIYKGASYSIKSGTGNFTISTQYKNILLLRMPIDLKLNTIKSINMKTI